MNEMMSKPKATAPGITEHTPADEVWGDPIPLPVGLPPVASFGPELLPEAFRSWVMDIANRMQCPPDYPGVAAIVTASAVMGRQIGIYPKRRDDWLVVPNLWGAVVGRPSLMKTPALAEARKMLARLEAEARKKYEAELEEYELAGTVARIIEGEKKKTAAKNAKKAIADGGDPRDAARAAMKSNANDDTSPPVRRRYVSQDTTVEKLGELLNETTRGLLIFRDELVGFLRSMDKDGHENDRGFYLEAWNGNGAYTYDRIARGTLEIDAACVALLGGIQPGPLRAYIAQANAGGAGDDGLLQRMQLLVWPDRADEWVNVDQWPDTEAKTRAYEIFERLDRITPQLGPDVPGLRFDEQAQQAFNTWREAFEYRFITEEMPPALEAHLTKYRSLLPSLALIFHMIDTPDAGSVGVEHVRRGIFWLEYLETHARRLYAQILDPGMMAAIALAERLPELDDPFHPRDVYRKGWSGLDRHQTDKALEVLVDLNHVAPRPGKNGGRPTTLYAKNPAQKFSRPLKGGTDKTDKKGEKGGFVSFVSTSSKELPENFSDEVAF
jgi:putative DNA primase/helicase